jgi:hypothetical protein
VTSPPPESKKSHWFLSVFSIFLASMGVIHSKLAVCWRWKQWSLISFWSILTSFWGPPTSLIWGLIGQFWKFLSCYFFNVLCLLVFKNMCNESFQSTLPVFFFFCLCWGLNPVGPWAC